MTTIEAVYSDGVFKPVEPVSLAENERVRLQIEIVPAEAQAWFSQMRESREQLAAKYGAFPDSAADIREDRRRND